MSKLFVGLISLTLLILFILVIVPPQKGVSQKIYAENHTPAIEFSYKNSKKYMKIDSLLVDTSKFVYEYFKLEGEDVYLIKIKPKNEK